MERIRSLEEIKSIISSYKKIISNSCSNIPLNRDIFKKRISENACFCIKNDDACFFLTDEGCYYNLYYLVSKNDRVLKLERQSKELVINDNLILKSDEELSDKFNSVFLNSGFRIESINYQVTFNLEDYKDRIINEDETEEFLKKNNYQLFLCKNSFPKRVFELWKTALKKTDIPYDHRSEGNCLCLSDENGEIIAVVWFQNRNGISEWRHFVVDEQYRNRGIGKNLCYKWLSLASKDGIKKGISWIEDNNIGSMRFHERMGFEKNGKVNIQYVLPRS